MALDYFQRSLKLSDALEARISENQEMIDLLFDQKRFTEAFAYAERAKGRTLLEILRNGRTEMAQSISPEEEEQKRRLSRNLVSLNRQIARERLKFLSDQGLLCQLEAQLQKARSEFEAFQTNLYASHSVPRVRSMDLRPISLEETANSIPDAKTAFLDFIVTAHSTRLFVLTKNSSGEVEFNAYSLNIESKSLGESVDRFRRRLANKDIHFREPSRELYEWLLKPAREQLQNKTSLIISPDGVLWELPFQVLQSETGRYVIEDCAISYAPSLSVLREMQSAPKRSRTATPVSLLAIGNPALAGEDIDPAEFAAVDEKLDPLPDAERQLRALGRLYGKMASNVLTGEAAREQVVKQESARYRILHFAAHGMLDDANPMYSHVMLSQASEMNEEDGLLEARELMNLKLNADLVVLSACETARGRVSAGEGIIGLTWALFAAGCPTTVVSQWKVESSSTTALMLEFHQRFKTRFDNPQGAPTTAESLRQAALKLMRDSRYRHPFFWGGFVVVGDGS